MTRRPYSVMVHPHRPTIIGHEDFLTRAALECDGWWFLADYPFYHEAAARESAFNALPPVERWWAASFTYRLERDDE